MKGVVMFLLVLFSIQAQGRMAEGAQQAEVKEVQVEPVPNPASREDVERATREMKRAILRSEQKSARDIAVERENARKQSEALRAEQQRQLELLAEKQRQANMEARAEAERLATRNQRFLIATLVLSVIILGAVLFILGGRKSDQVKTETEKTKIIEKETSLSSLTMERFLISDKTTIKDVRFFAEEKPVLRELLTSKRPIEIPCILVLPYREGSELNGTKLNCTVILSEDGNAMVRFDAKPDESFAWKNRNYRAAEIAKSQKSEAA